jgi:hypothetical protein
MWYFSDEQFGARAFRADDGSWLLVNSPVGDGPRAYALRSDSALLESPDDAMSVMCDWGHVRGAWKCPVTDQDLELWRRLN